MDRQAGAPHPAVFAGRRIVNISTLEQRSPPFARPPSPCHKVPESGAALPRSLPQRTLAASLRIERAGPGERHARPDRLPPSIDQRTGRISGRGLGVRGSSG
jgi:hypothetical protein